MPNLFDCAAAAALHITTHPNKCSPCSRTMVWFGPYGISHGALSGVLVPSVQHTGNCFLLWSVTFLTARAPPVGHRTVLGSRERTLKTASLFNHFSRPLRRNPLLRQSGAVRRSRRRWRSPSRASTSTPQEKREPTRNHASSEKIARRRRMKKQQQLRIGRTRFVPYILPKGTDPHRNNRPRIVGFFRSPSLPPASKTTL